MEISILFYLWKYRSNSRGLTPLYCRITLKGKRYQFSTKIFVDDKFWRPKRQLLVGSPLRNEINQLLRDLRNSLLNSFFELKRSDRPFSAKDVYQFEVGQKELSLLEIYAHFLSEREKLSGHTFSKNTHKTIKNGYSFLSKTLQALDMESILICDFSPKVARIVYQEGIKLGYAKSTMYKYMQLIKQIFRYAVSEDYTRTNPLQYFKLERATPKIEFLNSSELKKLSQLKDVETNLAKIRDCFLFSCYTGLAYNEAKSFRHTHLELEKDEMWIKVYRKKTGKTYSIPVLPEAKKIIEKYRSLGRLPLISNQKFNKYLKDVTHLAGINKRCTHHMARKTFATTILLSNGVPMEIVSKLLGHSNINITSSTYASVDKSLISKHIKQLNNS